MAEVDEVPLPPMLEWQRLQLRKATPLVQQAFTDGVACRQSGSTTILEELVGSPILAWPLHHKLSHVAVPERSQWVMFANILSSAEDLPPSIH